MNEGTLEQQYPEEEKCVLQSFEETTKFQRSAKYFVQIEIFKTEKHGFLCRRRHSSRLLTTYAHNFPPSLLAP